MVVEHGWTSPKTVGLSGLEEENSLFMSKSVAVFGTLLELRRKVMGYDPAMRVTIDTSACQGHGRCFTVAPEVYESDDEGYGKAVSEVIAPDLESQAELGRASCPERAIRLTVDQVLQPEGS
jgi:ferredoxin